MHVNHLGTARALMQVIHVLRDQGRPALMLPLEAGDGLVRRIRMHTGQPLPPAQSADISIAPRLQALPGYRLEAGKFENFRSGILPIASNGSGQGMSGVLLQRTGQLCHLRP